MNAYANHVVSYLLAQSWQIAVLAAIVGLISLALRSRSAHLRYLLWLIVLARCLVPPFLTVPLAVLPERPSSPPLALQDLPQEHSIPEVLLPAEGAPRPHEPARTAPSVRGWIALAWAAGVLIFLLWVGGRAARYTSWLRERRRPLPSALQESIRQAGFHFRAWPGIWLLEEIGQPFVWGLLRGSVYLPADFVGLNASDRQRSILAHELSHIARFDAGLNLLQILVQAVYWFHPFVWWVNRKIRQEREKCCDEMAVVHLKTPPEHYTGAIVEALAAERRSTRPVPSLAIVGSIKDIEERIRTMLKPGKTFHRRPSLVAAMVALLIALVTIPTALVLTARGEGQPTTKSADKAAEAGERPEQPRFAARTFNSKVAFEVLIEKASDYAGTPIGRTPSAAPLEIPACWLWWVQPLAPVKDWDLLAQEIGRNKIPGLGLNLATDSDLRHLVDLTELRYLNLRDSQITDAGLACLKGLIGLEELWLHNTQITGAGLVYLKGMTRLHDLWLFNTRITDAGLEHLKDLTGLQQLFLRGTQVTNMGLEHLKGLTGLQYLDLDNTQITDAGLAHLKSLTGLKTLLLGETQITDAGIEHLKGLIGLQRLWLNAQTTDVGLEHLKGLTGLEWLDLWGTRVTDAGLVHLEGLSGLQRLNLRETQITNAGLEHLKGLTGLYHLDLTGTNVTDAGLENLKGLAGLDYLDLTGTRITDTGMEHLKGLTKLTGLTLTGTRITDIGLAHLKGLTGLEGLSLNDTQITDAGLQNLRGLTGLRGVWLTNTPVTDAGLEHLKGLGGLEYLDVTGTRITDAGLACLKGLTRLRELKLGGTQVTDAGVQQLNQSLPNLTIAR